MKRPNDVGHRLRIIGFIMIVVTIALLSQLGVSSMTTGANFVDTTNTTLSVSAAETFP